MKPKKRKYKKSKPVKQIPIKFSLELPWSFFQNMDRLSGRLMEFDGTNYLDLNSNAEAHSPSQSKEKRPSIDPRSSHEIIAPPRGE